jgi:hypothetical protein
MQPSASINDENSAYLGTGGLLSIFFAISVTKVPEIRMIPTPPFPGGVAIAAIVS